MYTRRVRFVWARRGGHASSAGCIRRSRKWSYPRGDDHASDYDKRAFVAGDVIRIAKFGTSSGINYKRTATGTWAPVDEANPMTTTGGEKFTATFPSDFDGIQPDQRTADNFWKSNQLSNTATAQGNRASFTFAPAACKITVIIIYEADNDAQGTTLTGKGLCSGNQSQNESIQLFQTNSSDNKKRHTYAGIFRPVPLSRIPLR